MTDRERPVDSPQSETHQQPSISRRTKILALLLTLIGVPLVALVILEIVFQVLVPVTDIAFYAWDPILGPRHPPHLEGRYIHGEQINTRFHFNAQGWNHIDDYETEKPPGGRRVCIVGDSMIEALQVNPEDSMFVHASRIMSKPERPVQWYAFGVSGWGTTHETAAISHYLLEYRPDTVILMFVQNDPMDSSPFLPPKSSDGPRYHFDENGELLYEFPPFWQPSTFRRILARSALVRYFANQKRILERWRLRNRRINQNVPLRLETIEAEGEDPGLATREDQHKQIWALIEALLAECKKNCQQNGAQFVVTFRGHYKEMDAMENGETYESPPRETDPYCMGPRLDNMGRDFVEPICRRLDIPYLDLTDTIKTHLASKHIPYRFTDDVHYNAQAHKVVAEALSAWVESLWATSAEPD